MQDKTNEEQNLASSNHREAVIPEGYYSEKEVAGFFRENYRNTENRLLSQKESGFSKNKA